ncbi:hypothetical protein NDU88_005644 [Pleurodeles waltl]|uniref:Uncharacterized protein n=1 Tax=Pleurodeles waltl TaxID=8319 RepID=A0AAV7MDJ5_PLEWA|nr:hypothetical protein NDU88_005644 [Pleurodeles waltl]
MHRRPSRHRVTAHHRPHHCSSGRPPAPVRPHASVPNQGPPGRHRTRLPARAPAATLARCRTRQAPPFPLTCLSWGERYAVKQDRLTLRRSRSSLRLRPP